MDVRCYRAFNRTMDKSVELANQHRHYFTRTKRYIKVRKSLFTYFIPGILFLVIFLCMALFNCWFKYDTNKLSSQIDGLRMERELLIDEVAKLSDIEVEQFTSPERIRKIANKFNMILPKEKPIELKR